MTMTTTTNHRSKYNIESISQKLLEDITGVFEALDISEYEDYDNRIMFRCPIHGGDSTANSSIMKRGIGNWRCFSEQCHEEYGNRSGASLIQFIQAVLSIEAGVDIGFYEALKWSAIYVGEDRETAKPDDNVKTQFIQLAKYINRKKMEHTPVFTPRPMVRKFLQVPAEYYINRKYTEAVLDKFDIGYCFNPKKSFFDRVVTPFYDDLGEYMIGCSGRNKNEQCNKCTLYHAPNVRCPITKEEKLRATKWKHSGGFNADSYLYNYWNARQHIQDNYTAILVEGPGDVWRLEEAGIYNSLGLLGARLSSNQQIILEESGAINLILATDNDEAGRKVVRSVLENCSHLFNIHVIEYPGKDPGGLTVEQVKQIFIPILERI